MKQTAVEWLERRYYFTKGQLIDIDFEQAKELEKQQIIYAFINGDNTDCTQEEDILLYALEYYNETFNK